MTPDDKAPIDTLRDIMIRLRDPRTGCPWDVEQTFRSIAPHTIEEAYEVAEAIERDDMTALREELGDLLLQVVFHARIAEEMGAFSFDDVAKSIADKLIVRHPHVFSDAVIKTADEQTAAWEEQKARERAAKSASASGRPSVLADVSVALPATTRALKLQKRAARVGFDWDDIGQIVDKIEEELEEVRQELAEPRDPARVLDEVGDLLFVCVNLARKLDIDPETALRHTNDKFIRRFNYIERILHENGQTPEGASLQEMEDLWQAAKLEPRPDFG